MFPPKCTGALFVKVVFRVQQNKIMEKAKKHMVYNHLWSLMLLAYNSFLIACYEKHHYMSAWTWSAPATKLILAC